MWREDWEALGIAGLADGARVVAAGGTDFYVGSRTSSPTFSFAVSDLRVAGEGDLLAQLERLRRTLHAEGLFEPPEATPARGAAALHRRRHRRARQGARRRPRRAAPPRLGGAPGVGVRARPGPPRRAGHHAGAAGPRRLRGGRRDRRRARRRLARRPVRLLRRDAVPHRGAAAGAGGLLGRPPHRPDADRRRRRRARARPRRTPPRPPCRSTAPRPASPCRRPPGGSPATAAGPCCDRARTLARLSRAPADHVARHRARLHQHLRELRASARRGVAGGRRDVVAQARALERNRRGAGAGRGRADLERLALALAAHDPQRTLERGYALVEDPAGEPVTSAAAAREQDALTLRMHDGRVEVRRAGAPARRARPDRPPGGPRLFEE